MSNVSRLMSLAKPNLASAGRRVAAFAIDAVALFLACAVAFGIAESLGISSLALAFTFPVVIAAYQTAAVLKPAFGLGRTVLAIAVVSIRRNGQVSTTQAVARAATRILIAALGVTAATSYYHPWVMPLPVLVELALITLTPWRQSLADLIAGTVVINTPTLQPHRAPAGPMFSKDDAEFGTPPRRGG
jgi:uncharacterized RDD family membrane protein YckC